MRMHPSVSPPAPSGAPPRLVRYVGLDVHKKSVEACVLDWSRRKPGPTKSLSETWPQKRLLPAKSCEETRGQAPAFVTPPGLANRGTANHFRDEKVLRRLRRRHRGRLRRERATAAPRAGESRAGEQEGGGRRKDDPDGRLLRHRGFRLPWLRGGRRKRSGVDGRAGRRAGARAGL